VRIGSEGYEVRPVGREEMLRKYLEELGEEPGRYVRYMPETDSNSEEFWEKDREVDLENYSLRRT
jgi:palmitoyltransferase